MIDKKFIGNLDLVRSNFKGSQIIVSTWEVQDNIKTNLMKNYEDVIFIFNKDIGSISKDIDGIKFVTNLNRMIVSTYNGLISSSKKISIKIRTDSYFYDKKIIYFLDEILRKNKLDNVDVISRMTKFCVFDRYVINCNLFARNPHSHLPFLFHPGDILFAGLTSDLLKLFEIPLSKPKIIEKRISLKNICYMRYSPEQYIWVECIKKINGGRYVFEGNFNYTSSDIVKSEIYYVNNFIPFDTKEIGFCWPKHSKHYFNKGRLSIYRRDDWINLYRKYVIHKPIEYSLGQRIRGLMITSMKIYFLIRNMLLRFRFVRRLTYRLFVKRG
ncbi:hypothetical protein Xekj_04122 [Xenorhabdus sp. KJ12.1]|nr:hypothetical protein Xekj_04122 [Xenorhabdus sp. KJ12.1]